MSEDVDTTINYIKDNWGKLPLSEIKRETGLSTGELYWIAYAQLKLPRRKTENKGLRVTDISHIRSVTVHGTKNSAGNKIAHSIEFGRVFTKAIGWEPGERAPIKTEEHEDRIVITILKKPKQETSR